MIRIISECFAETALLKVFSSYLNVVIDVQHEAGISNVAKSLQSANEGSDLLIGWIDNDKNAVPSYLKEFLVLVDKTDYQLKKHISKNQFLIVISPAIEKFILNAVTRSQLKLYTFKIPDNLRELKKMTKKQTIETNLEFKTLVKELINHNISPFPDLLELLNSLE
ncbi:MAG: hypothetical protein ACKVOU_09215 [Cytophagales bacterium]